MHSVGSSPVARVRVSAPVRIADVGGWTDTWFGGPGQVCSIAVSPGVTVTGARYAETAPAPSTGSPVQASIVVHGASVAEPVRCELRDGQWTVVEPVADPLLAHTIVAIGERAVDWTGHATFTIDSRVPPGASVGTSAAVLVALLGALDALISSGDLSPADLAELAHDVETRRVGREAGVQDQWAAAMGGVSLLRIDDFPAVEHEVVPVSDSTLAALSERLITVAFGAHDSSATHRQVIDAVVGVDRAVAAGPRATLARLADLAGEAAAALSAGDLTAYGLVLQEATEAQEALHHDLLGPAHRRAIEVARAHGATSWKVNGAGGDGGSLTILTEPDRATDVWAALRRCDPTWTILALRPTRSGVTRHD